MGTERIYYCNKCKLTWDEDDMRWSQDPGYCNCGTVLRIVPNEVRDHKRLNQLVIDADEILDFHQQCPTIKREENVKQ